MAKCPYCGNENPDASQFCAWCGRKKPDDLYLNADQFSEPWTYVPPSPAGQAQPGAFDPAQPTATPGTPKPAAADPWAATQAAAPAATPATSASDPWKAAMPTAQAEPPKPPTPAPQEPPKTKNKLLILLPFAAVILVIVIAALVVPRFSSRQAPREAENNATTAAQTTAVQTIASADGTIQINKPAAELPGAQHWSDDTADYAYYIVNGDSGTSVYVVITNKTDRDIDIRLTARAKNASGAFVGDDGYGRFPRLGAGCTTMEWFSWFDPISAASIVFEPEYSDPASSWKDAVPDLTVKDAPNAYDSDVDFEITNHGSGTAELVYAQALFFDSDGKFIYYSNDGVDDIAPGATVSGKLYTFAPFETFEIYVEGYYKS